MPTHHHHPVPPPTPERLLAREIVNGSWPMYAFKQRQEDAVLAILSRHRSARIAELEKALTFYADSNRYDYDETGCTTKENPGRNEAEADVLADNGQRARLALSTSAEGEKPNPEPVTFIGCDVVLPDGTRVPIPDSPSPSTAEQVKELSEIASDMDSWGNHSAMAKSVRAAASVLSTVTRERDAAVKVIKDSMTPTHETNAAMFAEETANLIRVHAIEGRSYFPKIAKRIILSRHQSAREQELEAKITEARKVLSQNLSKPDGAWQAKKLRVIFGWNLSASAEGEKPQPRKEGDAPANEQQTFVDATSAAPMTAAADSPAPSTAEQAPSEEAMAAAAQWFETGKSTMLHVGWGTSDQEELASFIDRHFSYLRSQLSTVTRERDELKLHLAIASQSVSLDRYPNLDAAMRGCVSGSPSEWPLIRREIQALTAERDAAVKVIERIADPNCFAPEAIARDFLASIKENRT